MKQKLLGVIWLSRLFHFLIHRAVQRDIYRRGRKVKDIGKQGNQRNNQHRLRGFVLNSVSPHFFREAFIIVFTSHRLDTPSNGVNEGIDAMPSDGERRTNKG